MGCGIETVPLTWLLSNGIVLHRRVHHVGKQCSYVSVAMLKIPQSYASGDMSTFSFGEQCVKSTVASKGSYGLLEPLWCTVNLVGMEWTQ